ncbi:MAG: pyridoxine 5'-phosphate synthase [Acidimicrobiia bacterium]|nr:pyridoxine 5'-phosphate synthase [Acidimicrobiia bacterium]
MTKLGVNIDHVATLREARKTNEPDPVAAAVIAELAGCQGITVHLRSDRRHIQDRDVELLRETVKTRLNLEMAATEEMIRFAREVKPDTATLVPELPGEITTQGGLDCVRNFDAICAAAQELEAAGVAVSLFVDPERSQIEAAQRIGVSIVEINTAEYADASLYLTLKTEVATAKALERLKTAAIEAGLAGIRVHAGHGLTYRNVRAVSQIPEIEELNIGHNIISRAVLVGLDAAVREMIALLKEE